MNEQTFISYAREDLGFATSLAKKLRADRMPIWFDQLDIGAGKVWDREIEQGLKSCGRLIVILSPDSVASENVMDEVSYAIDEGKEIIPLLYRDCDIPMRLRRTQYIDFRAKDNAAAIARLEGALKGKPLEKLSGPALTPRRKRLVQAGVLLLLLVLAIGAWSIWGGADEPTARAGRLEGFMYPAANPQQTLFQLAKNPFTAVLKPQWISFGRHGSRHYEATKLTESMVRLDTSGATPKAIVYSREPGAPLKFPSNDGPEQEVPLRLEGVARTCVPADAPPNENPDLPSEQAASIAVFGPPGSITSMEENAASAPSGPDVWIHVVNRTPWSFVLQSEHADDIVLNRRDAERGQSMETFKSKQGTVWTVHDQRTKTDVGRFEAKANSQRCFVITMWRYLAPR